MMRKRKWLFLLLAIPTLIVLAFLLYQIPPIKNRLSPHIDNLRAQIQYAINPPEEAIFVPVGVVDQATPIPDLAQLPDSGENLVSPTPTATVTATLPPDVPTPTPEPSTTPTATPIPLPESVVLDGVVYVDQHSRWNYCGPANLTMALKFWGWTGNRDDVARVVKPGVQDPTLEFIQQGRWDKNVMPYELADFVREDTEYNALIRYGGDLEVVKRLIVAGFPVLIEKGYYEADYTGKVAWLGHYLFTTGYDDTTGEFIVQDAYLIPGKDLRVDYETYMEGWRSFDYLFMVIYPPEREEEVYDSLGPYADHAWANQHALDTAIIESEELTGIDRFFAWFNRGTSLVQLQQYVDAGYAYDQAFALYEGLESDDSKRPYRIMWYQTGPYWAYYYSARYLDVIERANKTLETVSPPTLEESIYWRGMAFYATGQTDRAVGDFRETVRLNPNFSPGWAMLDALGVGP